MHILIVEDDLKMASYVSEGFRQAGYTTTHAKDGLTGALLLAQNTYDLVLMDVMLPGRDGLSLIRDVRARGLHVPIIVLSARGSVEAKVQGLEAGGDDYLSKPFSITELLARAQALLRRAHALPETTCLRLADLEMDLLTHKVTRGGRALELQPLEYQLLEYLLRNKGRVVSKTTIMDRVWGYSFDPHTNVVEVRVSHLRAKLTHTGEKELLHTMRRFGYVLEERN